MAEISTGSAGSPDASGSDDRVSWTDLRQWLELLAQHDQLHRVTAQVDPIEELSGITLMAASRLGAPALLFENLNDNPNGMRVLANMLGSSKERYALALGFDPSLSVTDLIQASRKRGKTQIAPVEIEPSAAPVNEVVVLGDDIDLTQFPIPQFWPGDGGRYIGTGDVTITRDPASGRINVGVYRQMLHSARRVGLYCSPGKHGRLDREAWWKRGEPCEVVAAYGVDPVLFMVGAQTFGSAVSELAVAGGLMGRPVEMTRAETVSLPIPAHAEIVIEGLLHGGVTELEGPLGEFTGYYGNERGPQPVIEVTALHYRKNPILTAALMATYPAGEIGAYYAIMRSARIFDDLDRIGVSGISGVYAYPAAAAGWGMVVVSLRQLHAGHVAQVLALVAQCPAAAYYTKWIIAVDDDVDPTNIDQVLWALSTRCHPTDDIDVLRKTWSTGLDPSQFPPAARSYGSKVLIDACKPHRFLDQFPKRTHIRRSVYDQALARWPEFGLPYPAPVFTTFHDD